MKFTLLTNAPWSPSGYGQQTRIFSDRIANLGHEIGIICYYGLEGGVMKLNDKITCFPKHFHPYGNDISVAYTSAFGGQFMMSLMDTWVMNPEEYPMGFKWVALYPVDHDPMPEIVRQKLRSAWRRIAISKYGVTQTNNAGMDCMYVPHAVETQMLKRTDKAEARKMVGLPEDKWIVGTVAMNKGNSPSRKNFAEHMIAFAKFHEKHPDTFYFLQTNRGEGIPDMVNIPELGGLLGLRENIDYGFCNQLQNALGYPAPYFADLYSAMDVHLLASAGEGFGIPTLEAQACGTPVIVGDWMASGELCFAGHKIDKKDAEAYYTPQASYNYKPHIGAIVEALEDEYNHPTDTSSAVEFIKAEYDADVVTEKYWKPALANIEAGLHE